MSLPPRPVRRLVLAPTVFLVSAISLLLLPLWLLVAAFASRFVPGRWRILRLTWFFAVYLAFEALMLIALLGLWIGSGFGQKLGTPAFETRHYRLMGWFLRRVVGNARRTFGVRIEREDSLDQKLVKHEHPFLIFSRHAGPGDSFLLVEDVLNNLKLRPRIVLKDTLQLDPAIDIVLNRLPNRFVPSTGRAGDKVVQGIGELATSMTAGDALILFPEGGNFTPGRRERAIAHLEKVERPDLAERARELQHVLPPKPTGALTAIEAAPTADIILVGHAGLEQMSTLGDLWRGLPMDAGVSMRRWRIPVGDLPDPSEREAWLYDAWELIDSWIDERLNH